MSEADVRLFCAVLRALEALTLGEGKEMNRQVVDDVLHRLNWGSGVKLAGLHRFALAFYTKLLADDAREGGELWVKSACVCDGVCMRRSSSSVCV